MPNQSRHIILIGDLGVGSNIIKNLFFLDPSYSSHFDLTLLDTLYIDKDQRNWLTNEYKTRGWKQDISDQVTSDVILDNTTPAIYINHSVFHTPADLDILLKQSAQCVVLLPKSKMAFDWQIRAYCEKKGIDQLHNFSFQSNTEVEKQQYIEKYGLEEYQRFNILNMYEILNQRRIVIEERCQQLDIDILYTDYLYQGKFNEFYDQCKKYVIIDKRRAQKIYQDWLTCHWPYEQTNEWKYYAKT